MMKLSKRMILLGVVQIPVGSELLRGQQIWRTHLHVLLARSRTIFLGWKLEFLWEMKPRRMGVKHSIFGNQGSVISVPRSSLL